MRKAGRLSTTAPWCMQPKGEVVCLKGLWTTGEHVRVRQKENLILRYFSGVPKNKTALCPWDGPQIQGRKAFLSKVDSSSAYCIICSALILSELLVLCQGFVVTEEKFVWFLFNIIFEPCKCFFSSAQVPQFVLSQMLNKRTKAFLWKVRKQRCIKDAIVGMKFESVF